MAVSGSKLLSTLQRSLRAIGRAPGGSSAAVRPGQACHFLRVQHPGTPDRFRVSYAISREQARADGGKMYVQDRMAEHAEELFERMAHGAHMYFCGLKGMMPGILEMLEGVAASKARRRPPQR